ncbi:MAG: cell division protein FtsX [Candidatus Magasanikbacteria bacterium]
MFLSLWRIIKFGFKNFFRNSWLSISTISVMILTLVVFEGLILFNVVSDNAVEAVKDKVDISVYFQDSASEGDILNIKKTLEGFKEVENVTYISKSKALKRFKKRNPNEEVISKTLDELEGNPLSASLNIKAKELSQYDSIASYLNSDSLKKTVKKVTYGQNELVINRLQSIIQGVNAGVLILTLFLSFLAVVVTLNTISLAIFSNKEQINIMRMVGADNKFIRGPYVVEGVIYGIIAALVSFIIFVPLVNFVSPHIADFITNFSLKDYFNKNTLRLVTYQLIMGVGLGIISSILAVRKYLKV